MSLNRIPDIPYIIFGYWNASVDNFSLLSLYTNFTMSRTNGSQTHNHQITNFKPLSSVILNNEGFGSARIFAGTADIYTNNSSKWNNVSTAVIIENFNLISIAADSTQTDNHFNGQSVGGIVESVKNANGAELLLLDLEPISLTIPVEGSNVTANTNNQNDGNQNTGGTLSNMGEAIRRDLFGG